MRKREREIGREGESASSLAGTYLLSAFIVRYITLVFHVAGRFIFQLPPFHNFLFYYPCLFSA